MSIQGELKITEHDPKEKWKYTKDGTTIEKTHTFKFQGKLKGRDLEIETAITLKCDAAHYEEFRTAFKLYGGEPAIEVNVKPTKQTTLDAPVTPKKTANAPGQKRFGKGALDFLPEEEKE